MVFYSELADFSRCERSALLRRKRKRAHLIVPTYSNRWARFRHLREEDRGIRSLACVNQRSQPPDRSSQRGVTLIEMMIVVTLVALIAGISYPSVASGLETLRLRSASDSIVSLLNTALDRADRRQQAVEIWISPTENAIAARSADNVFNRRIDLGDRVHIASILPAPASEVSPTESREFIVYPGGAVPRITIALATGDGRKRTVRIDPITGVPLAK